MRTQQHEAGLHEHLVELQARAAGAACWLESSEHLDARDLAFLGRAREDILRFAELGLRLADLHRPLDGGGTSSDPGNPVLRCRSCMWRWPCPTFRLLTEYLDPPSPYGPGRR